MSRTVAILATAVVLAATGAPRAQSVENHLATRLDGAVARHLVRGFAVSVLVARDGRQLLRKGYGVAGHDGQPTGPDTLFDVASLSKSFTAAAILVLEQRGKLSVHDRIDRHLRDVPKDKAGILIHHLLTHTSGLAADIDFTDEELRDREAWLARVWRQPLRDPPGDRFSYSNTGYSVLAALVEVVTRKSFESWVDEHLFSPAEMQDTGFLSDAKLDAGRAAARRQATDLMLYEDTAIDWPWHWSFRGATGIVTTVDDLYRWDRALYGDRVLGAAQRAKMFTPSTFDYAYGWVATRTERGTTRLSHEGSTYGFRAALARFPDEDAAVILAGNREGRLRELSLELEKILFEAPEPRPLLESCAGRFRLPNGDEWHVQLEDRQLVVRPLGIEAATRFLHGRASPGDDPYCRKTLADHALELLKPLTRGRHGKLSESFAKGTPDAHIAAAAEAWKRLQGEHGSFRRARIVGSLREESASYLVVTFGKTPTTWRAQWQGRKAFTRLVPTGEAPPLATPLSWRHGRVFHLRSADGLTDLAVSFEVDRKGRAVKLLWRDRSNPAGHELECRRM